MMISVAIAVILSAQSSPATSSAPASMSGNQLQQYCDLGKNDAAADYLCKGYISGAVDAIRATDSDSALPHDQAKLFCVPNAVTPNQMRDVVANWLEKNPEIRHYGAASLVLTAMIETYPC